MIKDYYYLLGLPRGAPLSDIKQAYRKLAAQYHPDKVAGMSPEVQQEATARMMELNEAIAIFTDPDQRAVYDENVELIPQRTPRRPPPPPPPPPRARGRGGPPGRPPRVPPPPRGGAGRSTASTAAAPEPA